MAGDNNNYKLKWRVIISTELLIILALSAQTVFSEQNATILTLSAKTALREQNNTIDNHDRIESLLKTIEKLKLNLEMKENNLREKLKNLTDDITEEFCDTKININKVYETIKSNANYSENELCSYDDGKPQTANSKKMTTEFLKEIENNNFDKAAHNLIQLDENDICTVVAETYKRSNENGFNSLLSTCEKVTNLRRQFLLYKAVYSQVKRENDGYKYLQLMDKVNKEILSKDNVDPLTLQDAQILLKELRLKTEHYASEFLKAAFQYYKNSTDIKAGNSLLNYLFNVDESLFEKVHQEFLSLMKLNGVYDEVFSNLLTLTKSRHNYKQEILLHIINFSIMKEYDHSSEKFVSKLFDSYKKVQQEMEKHLNESIDGYSKKLKTIIPSSLYTMMTAKKVCIRNVGLNEYLNTGGGNTEFYLRDKERRNVYTSAKNSHDGFGIWEIQHYYNDIYYLHNIDVNENMYTSVSSFVGDRHIVWMWIPDKNRDVYYNWKFEFSGDHVYIKSAKFNEYLYGSAKSEEPSLPDWIKGHVYTLQNGKRNCPDNYCLWSFEDCSDTV